MSKYVDIKEMPQPYFFENWNKKIEYPLLQFWMRQNYIAADEESIKPSLQFSFFCVSIVSKGNLLGF